jgi:hypothetical protein
MVYYIFRRRKDYRTMTYGIIVENNPSILPDNVWDGLKYIKGNPWEAEGIIDEENEAPRWFRRSDADENIERHGFWLVDMQEDERYYNG